MAQSITAYIGLGSNLGDKTANIAKAVGSLKAAPGIDNVRVSELIETEPVGPAQPTYLNAVAEIQATLDAEALFGQMTKIEDSLGRVRNQRWGPRTIDLDLLLYGDEVIKTENLTVPHRQMHLRSFVLKGLCEFCPDMKHPVLKVNVSELAARLNGGDFALNPKAPQLVSVAGLIGVGKTTAATRLAKHFSASLLLEPYDTNPFLADVYAGRTDLALHSELYFLFARIEQMSTGRLQSDAPIFADYVFDKQLIYAKRLLNQEQLSVYEDIYPASASAVARPVLVLYLADSVENCLDRIHARNRPYEQRITAEYLRQLSSDYEQLFGSWKRCPVIQLSMQEFDCRRDSDLRYIADQVRAYITVDRN